jgi:hypothetical protein
MTDMMTIYEYNECRYYTGRSREITIYDGVPPMWSQASMPDNPDNLFAVLSDDAKSWSLTDVPAPTPVYEVHAPTVPTPVGEAPVVL